MGWNVYDEPVLKRDNSKYVGQSEKEVLAEIFLQHAIDGVLPVTPWHNAAQSVSREFGELQSLSNPTILGRVFQMIDSDHDGILDEDEFVNGLYELLHPTTKQGMTLAARIAKANLVQVSNEFGHVKTVAILGAGVAGLQTARQLQEIGIACTIFEKEEEVGGVWRKNYADFGLQVPKELYEFPDFPYPENFKCEDFPTGSEVQDYIVMYSKTFGLRDKIRFKTFVTEVKPLGSQQRGWQVEFHSTEQGDRTKKSETFDFLVIATGMYGWPPHVPLARGSQKFQGQILHSCTFTDRTQAAGKKVVIVGGGKSAIDNAVSAAKEGVSSTLVCRSWHWPVPRLLLNAVPFKYGTYSRFGHWMLQPYYAEGPVARWFHGTCAPVKWIWWRVVELMFRGQFQIPSNMVPQDGIDIDLFSGGQILNYEFRDMLQDGKIKALSGAIDKFTETGVILTDGTELPADLVIYGTGFAKNYDIFDKVIQEKLAIRKDGLYLYCNIIPPNVPDVAFIGSEVSTFNNILTHALQAKWLCKLLKGEMKIPAPGAMDKVIEHERAWKRSWMPPMSSRACIWQLHMMKYHDNLLTDMKGTPALEQIAQILTLIQKQLQVKLEELHKLTTLEMGQTIDMVMTFSEGLPEGEVTKAVSALQALISSPICAMPAGMPQKPLREYSPEEVQDTPETTEAVLRQLIRIEGVIGKAKKSAAELLARPPPKFLLDVAVALKQATGFPAQLEETWPDSREDRLARFQQIADAINGELGIQVDFDGVGVLKGKEVPKTLRVLQLLALSAARQSPPKHEEEKTKAEGWTVTEVPRILDSLDHCIRTAKTVVESQSRNTEEQSLQEKLLAIEASLAEEARFRLAQEEALRAAERHLQETKATLRSISAQCEQKEVQAVQAASTADQELQELERQLEELSDPSKFSEANVMKLLAGQLDALKVELEHDQEEVNQLQDRRKEVTKALNESTSHARLVEAEVQRARQKREADEELIGQAPEEQLQILQARGQELRGRNEDLEQQLAMMSSEVEEHRNANRRLMQENSECMAKAEDSQLQMQIVQEERDSLREAMEQLWTEKAQVDEDLEIRMAGYINLSERLNLQQDDNQDLEMQIEQKKEQIAEMQRSGFQAVLS